MSPVGTKYYRFNRLRAVDKLRQSVTIRNHMKATDRLKKSGMTRSEIAAAIAVSRHAVRFWEMGLRSPPHDSRAKLLDPYGNASVRAGVCQTVYICVVASSS